MLGDILPAFFLTEKNIPDIKTIITGRAKLTFQCEMKRNRIIA